MVRLSERPAEEAEWFRLDLWCCVPGFFCERLEDFLALLLCFAWLRELAEALLVVLCVADEAWRVALLD